MTNILDNPDAADKPHPIISPEECKGCGRCVAACPRHVLRFRAQLNSRGLRCVEYDGGDCIGCAACFYTCPEPNALSVRVPDRTRKPAPAKPSA